MKELFTPEWYPFYQKKFTSATQLYNAEAIGAYIVLLNYQWDNGGLPDDTEELMALAKCSEQTLKRVIKKFTKLDDGLFWNKRLEVVREEQHRKYLINKARADKANATIKQRKKEDIQRPTLRPTSKQRNDNVTYKDKEEDISKDIPKKEKLEDKNHRFKNSPFFLWENFKAEWERRGLIEVGKQTYLIDEVNIKNFYQRACDYTESDATAKYANWVAAARSWCKKAIQEGRLAITQPSQNITVKKFLGED